jgi:hypothetical protein
LTAAYRTNCDSKVDRQAAPSPQQAAFTSLKRGIREYGD